MRRRKTPGRPGEPGRPFFCASVAAPGLTAAYSAINLDTMTVSMTDSTQLTLEQLAAAADLPLRTVRFYIQKGLLARPHGSTRAAWYDAAHLETLLRIRKWSDAGLSLARIAELLTGADVSPPPRRAPGAIEVRTHVHLAEGLELVITPDQARLSPGQLRALVRAVLEAHAAVSASAPAAPTEGDSDE